MDKTEKRTAEEILEFQLNYSSMLFTDEMRSLYKRHAERAMHEYSAQELDAYKMKVQQEIKIAYDEMIRIGNIKRDLNVFAIMHQLQIKLK